MDANQPEQDVAQLATSIIPRPPGVSTASLDSGPDDVAHPDSGDSLAACSLKQRRYLSSLAQFGERDIAVKAAGIEPATVRNWRYRGAWFKALERKAEADGRGVGRELVRQRFGRGADAAGAVVQDIMNSDDAHDRDKLRAASILLDREYPVVQRDAGGITINAAQVAVQVLGLTAEQLADLARSAGADA